MKNEAPLNVKRACSSTSFVFPQYSVIHKKLYSLDLNLIHDALVTIFLV